MTQEKETTILTFEGEMTFETIENLLAQYKDKIDSYGVDMVIHKRLYSILVECLENTYRHKILVNNSPKHPPIEFSLKSTEFFFKIEIGNYINKKNTGKLIEEINIVNTLDRNGLNKLYRDSISKARISEKGGAGLGIIEIARNSRQKINYKLETAEGDQTFFKFIITVNKT